MLIDASGNSIVDYIYPVGSIYMSLVFLNPKNVFGGTWERVKGVSLIGINEDDTDTNKKTSTNQGAGTFIGSKYMERHTHTQALGGQLTTTDRVGGVGIIGLANGQETDFAGAGDAQNIPPSILVYMWKRTA